MKDESLDDILSEDEQKVETPQEEEPVQQEPTPEPEVAEQEPAPTEKETGLQAALTEARAKLRDQDTELEKLRSRPAVDPTIQQQLDALKAQIPQPKPVERQPLPDPLENPEAFNGQLSQHLQQERLSMLLDVDEKLARAKHGDALVNEAFNAAQAQGIASQFAGRENGWSQMAQWHADQQELSKVRAAGGYEKLREEIRSEVLAEVQANAVADAVAPATPSLAAETNIGRAPAPKPVVDESLKDLLGNEHDI